ncbi:glycosyltransferase [Fructilactobacillus sanfranciscensis]|uniref:glycosyltransferase n=1 Tax=Fructilactobacillus sanfranciscensis TaxID=1625 RepID=UPI00307D1DC6
MDAVLNNQDSNKNKSKVVFTIGRISTQKGPKVFNKIAESLPNTKFVWIGNGELRSQLTSPNIEVTGWKNRSEALKLASKYGIFLLTSKWEGLPISLLESMCMKKVCVVSNVSGNNNVIVNKENGYLCNSIDDYVNAIKRILVDTPNNIVNSAYNDIMTHYNSNIMVKEYANIYREKLWKIKSKNKSQNLN